MNDRLAAQISFILEADRLKEVLRQSHLLSGNRRENSAEHSWHLSILTLVLAEYSDAPIDVLTVLKMCILHDLVEIDAGDTFCYDLHRMAEKAVKEAAAAERLFGLLPPDQALDFRQVWEEFEHGKSPEARFARAVDRLMPILHNLRGEVLSWNLHGIAADQVLSNNAGIADASQELWAFIRSEVEAVVAAGLLPASSEGD